jgi:hypothetical protein
VDRISIGRFLCFTMLLLSAPEGCFATPGGRADAGHSRYTRIHETSNCEHDLVGP